jgi:hypothetical protein
MKEFNKDISYKSTFLKLLLIALVVFISFFLTAGVIHCDDGLIPVNELYYYEGLIPVNESHYVTTSDNTSS